MTPVTITTIVRPGHCNNSNEEKGKGKQKGAGESEVERKEKVGESEILCYI